MKVDWNMSELCVFFCWNLPWHYGSFDKLEFIYFFRQVTNISEKELDTMLSLVRNVHDFDFYRMFLNYLIRKDEENNTYFMRKFLAKVNKEKEIPFELRKISLDDIDSIRNAIKQKPISITKY